MTKSAEIIIREAIDADREAIAGVLLEAYSEYAAVLSEPFWIEYRDSILNSVHGDAPISRIVAELDGHIVGSVLLFSSSEAAYGRPEMGIQTPIIRLLAVSPSARGRGVARLLIREAANRSVELGAASLNLHTSDMMASAIKLYERLGFQRAYETDINNGDTLVKGYRIELPALPKLSELPDSSDLPEFSHSPDSSGPGLQMQETSTAHTETAPPPL